MSPRSVQICRRKWALECKAGLYGLVYSREGVFVFFRLFSPNCEGAQIVRELEKRENLGSFATILIKRSKRRMLPASSTVARKTISQTIKKSSIASNSVRYAIFSSSVLEIVFPILRRLKSLKLQVFGLKVNLKSGL